MDTKKISFVLTLAVALAFASAHKVYALSCSASTSGVCIAEIGTSTPAATIVQITVGPGSVNDIQLSSSTTADINQGAFCVLFDSAPAAGSFTGNAESAGTAAAPRLDSLQQTTINVTTRRPAGPSTPFTNGLVAICKGVARALIQISEF